MIQYIVATLTLGSIYTLFGLGLNLTWGILNVLNLAHGAILMAGALTGYVVASSLGFPLPLVLLSAMIVCGLIAVLLQLVAFGPIQRWNNDTHSAEFAILVAGVGGSAILIGIAENLTQHQIVAIPQTVLTVTRFDFFGVPVTNVQVIILVSAVVLSLLLAAFVNRTKYGRAMRALAFDPQAASMLGVKSSQLSLVTFFLSGALAGVAGVLLALHQGGVDAYMGTHLLLKAFAVIILGGVGSIGGTVVAAFLLALVESVVGAYLGATARDGVAFLLIIVLLLVRPQGLFARSAWQRA